jgi:trans-aconitate methyltransferase
MINFKDQIFNCKNIIIFSLDKKNFIKAFTRFITFLYKLNIFIFKIFFINKKIEEFSVESKRLNEVFIHFATNKGSHFFSNNIKHSGHGYDAFYEKLFKENRTKNLNIMEFGIHHGDSLAALSSYFPNAKIVGLDKNPFSANYKSKRIRTLHCDVSSEKNLESLSNYLNKDYDYIIDDASHNPIHQKLTLFSMFQNLKSGGIFVIEELNFFQSENNKDDSNQNFLRNLLIDVSKKSETILKSKYNDKIMDFIDDVQDVEINKGVLTHKGVNVSEIAFIKKK